MKRILTSVVLIVLLFPTLAMGGSAKSAALGPVLGEVTMDDLVITDGLFYKKFTDVPFTGNVTGKSQGSFKHGKRDGPWVGYFANGQLMDKGTYKDRWADGPWVGYHEDGTVHEEWTGTFKDDVKVSD